MKGGGIMDNLLGKTVSVLEPVSGIPETAIPLCTTNEQKSSLNNLLQSVIQGTEAGVISQSYRVKYPKGLPHRLQRRHGGGYGIDIVDENNNSIGSAKLYSNEALGAVSAVMSIMAAVSGQYFLSRIDRELAMNSEKLDAILDFLYGENRAELFSEYAFTANAHANFSSIVLHEAQRQATIQNLQSAQKTAIKDIEFYLSDLDATVGHPIANYEGLLVQRKKVKRAMECVELAEQVYVSASILEMYYSDNFDSAYSGYVKQMINHYLDRCDRQIISALSALESHFRSYMFKPFEKGIETRERTCQEIKAVKKVYLSREDSAVRQAVLKAFAMIEEDQAFYLDSNGNIYLETGEKRSKL